MNITTILGSPRKRGNTAAVLDHLEALLAPAHQVERINLVDYSVKGCRGCDVCQRVTDKPGCMIKDDTAMILDKMIASDIVVYASPVYVWSVTAQMKALLDRSCCLVKWHKNQVANALLEGRRSALLVTCAGTAEDNADLVQQIFDREMAYLRCKVVGKYVVAQCTTPGQLGSIAADTAQAMAGDITGR
jgi:multimeric flavodoxin WrbA